MIADTAPAMTWQQPLILSYDDDQCYLLVQCLIGQNMQDLRSRSPEQRENAKAWFEDGECEFWCYYAGLSASVFLDKAEAEAGKEPINGRIPIITDVILRAGIG